MSDVRSLFNGVFVTTLLGPRLRLDASARCYVLETVLLLAIGFGKPILKPTAALGLWTIELLRSFFYPLVSRLSTKQFYGSFATSAILDSERCSIFLFALKIDPDG